MPDMVFPKMIVDNGSTSSSCKFHPANAKNITTSFRTILYKLHDMNGCFQLFSAHLTFSQGDVCLVFSTASFCQRHGFLSTQLLCSLDYFTCLLEIFHRQTSFHQQKTGYQCNAAVCFPQRKRLDLNQYV